jgi:hypothetical protein
MGYGGGGYGSGGYGSSVAPAVTDPAVLIGQKVYVLQKRNEQTVRTQASQSWLADISERSLTVQTGPNHVFTSSRNLEVIVRTN